MHYLQKQRSGFMDKEFIDHFWEMHLQHDASLPPHTAVIVDGHHYLIGDEDSTSQFRGFAGAKFCILFNDGFYTESTNLWHQGEIDPEWRDKFPDNAKFIWKHKESDDELPF